ncbi:SMI1/KNR4 family protein [Corallococcus praedator]|uniref:SMI1/KNR4 family protein n=1 Tax=Corallococcus praedator TaxID=2316724 RepID=A0ABX9QE37_9BACT|nr:MULTISPECIES: SMI1/KNR4 family protein [Corallococcus]RKH25386.1 SMI1/KNR4 family protein [Corallococcus sp. CA031C]RKI02639.1 SMI1/KNR4 family protein [Corallococcus praedator]
MTTALRPKDVPPEATFDADANLWRLGGPNDSRERLWIHPSGLLLLDATRKDGKLDGEIKWSLAIHQMSEHAPRVALQAALGLPKGPTSTMLATFADGALVEVRFRPGFDFPDTLRVELRDGVIDGAVEWVVGPVEGALFEHAGTKLLHKVFKVPKPWPHRITAVFAKGKLKSTSYFAKDGTPLDVGKTSLTEWGEATEVSALAGYIERGDFAADAARFFPKAPRVSKPGSEKVRAVPAGRALDAVVMSGGVPSMTLAFDFDSYGFDCKKEELFGANDDKFVGIASDGSGEMFLLDVTTGAVVRYAHEEGTVAPAFTSLDQLAFSLLRVEAAAKKLIPKAKVSALFKRLGLTVAGALLKEY